MGLMWTFAEASGREYWKGMSWAMLPSLAAAMCACTWHLFYNAEALEVRRAARCVPCGGAPLCPVLSLQQQQRSQKMGRLAVDLRLC